MISVLSPARNTRAVEPGAILPTRPLFAGEALLLAERVRALAPWQLESLLDVDARRALALHAAYRRFSDGEPGAPALLAYWGAAYRKIDAQSLGADDLAFAQDHLVLLSALYGALRPLDGVQEHRLGLHRGANVGGLDLYEFWGDRVYHALFSRGEPVINLASQDYARLFEPYLGPRDAVINCRFQVQRPGGPRGTVATIRAARGVMARFIIEQRIDAPEGLVAFDADGYRFAPGGSDARNFLFIQSR